MKITEKTKSRMWIKIFKGLIHIDPNIYSRIDYKFNINDLGFIKNYDVFSKAYIPHIGKSGTSRIINVDIEK